MFRKTVSCGELGRKLNSLPDPNRPKMMLATSSMVVQSASRGAAMLPLYQAINEK
ncbi:hypothetical protein KAB67_000744 [Salmonella enterica]|nr:hypothetical protein [Salmonella enterica]